MKLSAIAAMGRNHELGYENDMPWKRALKKDLKFFREQTKGHPMVMGRKTFESLPGLLPGRKHIVITSSSLGQAENENLQVFPDLDAFFEYYQDYDEEIFVIGGASIYRQLLPYCQKLILTEIDGSFLADVYFPFFDPDEFDSKVLDQVEDEAWPYRHIVYTRKK